MRKPTNWRLPVLSGILGIAIGLTLGSIIKPPREMIHDDPMAAMTEQAADAFLASSRGKVAPYIAPPELTTYEYSDVGPAAGSEIRFQHRDLLVVLCVNEDDSGDSACDSPGVDIIRDERVGSTAARVAVVNPDGDRLKVDEHLDRTKRDFVLSFWKNVPLTTSKMPGWIVADAGPS